MVLALVVLALAAVYITTPKQTSKAYSADAVLFISSGEVSNEGAGFGNVRMAVRFVNSPEIAQSVATALGWTGSPEELSGKVSAVADPELLPFLTVTASGSSPEEAIRIANAFADGLITYVDGQEVARIQDAQEQDNLRLQEMQGQIAELDRQIAANPVNAASLQQQADTLRAQMGLEQFSEEDTIPEKIVYKVKDKAVDARTEASFIAGAGRPQRMLLGGVVAIMLGFGVAIMLDRSDSRLRTKDAVERHFGLPVLAEIPMLNLRDRSRAAVVAFERVPRIAESYRSLRTALLLFRGKATGVGATNGNGNGHSVGHADPNALRQLVVVTSPEAGDGKSTTTANLAMAYAETGQSVLLVSWDLWRPLSPEVFDAQEGPGVSDYLDGHGSSLVRYVQDTSIPGVRIVTAGLGGHHPTAQLEAARRLLEEARTLANVVIVDTAPILSASVTRELCTLADAVLVVCRSGRTTVAAADRCAELLERLGANTLGVVMVGVPAGPFDDYYGAPPKGGIRRPFDRLGLGGKRSDSPRGGRHKAPAPVAASRQTPPIGSSLRPTASQYRATSPRGPDSGREPR
ncbi:MAG TPA: hypothetical protein VK611_25675 [Acidimicrobiales bacterium]|nr:hypothetical protein [Acidimicrobiales bacterium]